jgi:hypothetical protein
LRAVDVELVADAEDEEEAEEEVPCEVGIDEEEALDWVVEFALEELDAC